MIDHDPSTDQAAGVEGVKQFWRGVAKSFPDFELEVDLLVASDEFVTIVYRMAGTHDGTYLGVPGTSRRFEVRGVQVAKFDGGLIVERWGSTDSLGMLSQLGIPTTARP